MSLESATILKIARLARIGLDQEAVTRLQGELNGIVGWVEQLNEVDVSGLAPLTSVRGITLHLRADVVDDGDCREAVLANAPGREGPFFAVPKVIE